MVGGGGLWGEFGPLFLKEWVFPEVEVEAEKTQRTEVIHISNESSQ